MPDVVITCADCHTDFAFTERDQQFYASQVDSSTGQPWTPPKRCKPCREARKLEKRSGSASRRG